ncbi:hypothetical protein EJ05DRAFT_250894 [Pseudovirgaria hyperparasitica]|uniref:CFEM domain-containing protein n=1 Tax=Pseudovirgaria hyperparasitica TaxID=470096 RepID=A0A6A6WDZ4_9PEZI|nr:uncharacterized protein EJ05DRAFT_250894 [Pseudovirgaria hyperparasitica]KAF2761042.1 hypothetical protein EJ05DRAFT_250894 [Pseudovirgaria hyperparasitica]
MKVTTTVLLGALAAQQAVATWDLHAPAFSCPSKIPHTCDDKEKSGFKWDGLKVGADVGNYNGYQFPGFKCSSKLGKRDNLGKRTFQDKCITGKVTKDKSAGPKITCPSKEFSIKEFQVSVDHDVDVEFHYGMPDGSICKQHVPCKAGGSTVTNTQCGGAKEVTFQIPQKGKHDSCEIGFHGIDFYCEKPSPPPQCDGSSNDCSTPTPPEQPPVPQPTPTGAVTTPTGELPKPTGELPNPTGELPNPTGELPNPTGELPKPTDELPNPTGELPKPTGELPNPTGEIPTPTGQTPTGQVPSSMGDTSSPADETPIQTGNPPAPYPPAGPSENPPEGPSDTPCKDDTCGSSPPAVSMPPTTNTSSPVFPSAYPPVGSDVVVSPSSISTPSTPSTPLPTADCPSELQRCINTFAKFKCTDNTDSKCYCKDQGLVKEIIDCVDAWTHDQDLISKALSFFVGICAPYVPKNPAIVTDCPTSITLGPGSGPAPTPAPDAPASDVQYPGAVTEAPQTPAVPAVTTPVTTLTVIQTNTPTYDNEHPESSVLNTTTITMTVPQVHFVTAPAPDQTGSPIVGLIPGAPAPVSANPTEAYPTGAYPTGAYSTGPHTTGFGTSVVVPTPTGTLPPTFTGAAVKMGTNVYGLFAGAVLAALAL